MPVSLDWENSIGLGRLNVGRIGFGRKKLGKALVAHMLGVTEVGMIAKALEKPKESR